MSYAISFPPLRCSESLRCTPDKAWTRKRYSRALEKGWGLCEKKIRKLNLKVKKAVSRSTFLNPRPLTSSKHVQLNLFPILIDVSALLRAVDLESELTRSTLLRFSLSAHSKSVGLGVLWGPDTAGSLARK